MLLGTAMLGKTTAHRDHMGVDPEETGAYSLWKAGWGDPRVAGDPAWREVQREVYRKLMLHSIRLGITPLLGHAGDEWVRAGIKSGYDVVVAHPVPEKVIPYLRKEAASEMPHVDNRLRALLVGYRNVGHLATKYNGLVSSRVGYATEILRDMGVTPGYSKPDGWPSEWVDLLNTPFAVWDRGRKTILYPGDLGFEEAVKAERRLNPRLKRNEAAEDSR